MPKQLPKTLRSGKRCFAAREYLHKRGKNHCKFNVLCVHHRFSNKRTVFSATPVDAIQSPPSVPDDGEDATLKSFQNFNRGLDAQNVTLPSSPKLTPSRADVLKTLWLEY